MYTSTGILYVCSVHLKLQERSIISLILIMHWSVVSPLLQCCSSYSHTQKLKTHLTQNTHNITLNTHNITQKQTLCVYIQTTARSNKHNTKQNLRCNSNCANIECVSRISLLSRHRGESLYMATAVDRDDFP